MEYECDSMFEFGKLHTYFEVHVADIDGECFTYNVYFNTAVTDQKIDEINHAIEQWFAPYFDQDIYCGYISVTKEKGKVSVDLDLGGVEDCDLSIYGIVKALNTVRDIKKVIINEDAYGFVF